MVGSGVQRYGSRLTVRSSRTGLEREYIVGNGSSWVAELARDLARRAL